MLPIKKNLTFSYLLLPRQTVTRVEKVHRSRSLRSKFIQVINSPATRFITCKREENRFEESPVVLQNTSLKRGRMLLRSFRNAAYPSKMSREFASSNELRGNHENLRYYNADCVTWAKESRGYAN